jgi:serine phosphatase RsbU (regulator of sigma subunit)
VAARTQRLTLAAELQWQLLPGRSRIRPSFSLAGQLEPAYAVRGDSFDWAEHRGRLCLSVLNGMGDGITAALLTSLAVAADHS